jgi:hypothetical protein
MSKSERRTAQRKALASGLYCLGIVLFLCPTLAARQGCSAEAKLLVSPQQVEASVVALDAVSRSRGGEVYLFDTDRLDLFAQGVIVRLRAGEPADLTVKIRSDEPKQLKNPFEEGGTFKCEVDLVGDKALTSYSLSADWNEGQIPQTGEALHSALSAGQLRLLAAAKVSIDWHRVKRMVQIRATDWKVPAEAPLKKVALELWEWPGGKTLELSAKADLETGSSTMAQLRQMAVARGLVVEQNQEPKTSLVLAGLSAAPYR